MRCNPRYLLAAGSPGGSGVRSVYSLPPPHLVHPHRVLEALRRELTAVREQEPLPAAQPAHRVRDKDLSTIRLRRNPRGQDHRSPEEVTVFFDRLASVKPNAHGERFAPAL